MNYSLSAREIAVVSAVVQYGSLTAAARHLGVSQPSISQTLSDVEKATGLSFFLRRGRSVEPTAAAQLVAQEGRGVIQSLERVTKAVAAMQSGTSDNLAVGAMAAFAESFVAEVVAGFSQNYPDVSIELRVVERAPLEDYLLDGLYDLAIGTLPCASTGIRTLAIKEAEVCCIMRPDHPLMNKSAVTTEDLAGETMVRLVKGSPLREMVDVHMGFDETTPGSIYAATQQAMVTMVVHGAGIGMIDPLNLTRLERDAVVVRPLAPSLFYKIGVMAREEDFRSKAVANLADALSEALASR